jgi:3-oxoacyl-[acyl-carrier-protein] synthase III
VNVYRSLIDSVGVALPTRSISTREMVDGCAYRLNVPLEMLTGITSRRVAGDGEFAMDLAVRAALDCLQRSSIPPSDVDLLLSTAISRHDAPGRLTLEPSGAARLRHALGCTGAWAFDVANACAGSFTGIYLADALIRSGQIRTALIVSGELITPLAWTAQKEITSDLDPRLVCLTLGDAGSAVLLTRADDDRTGFEYISMHTVGRHHSLCVAAPTDAPHGGMIMKTEMLPLAVIMVRQAVNHTRRALDELGRALTDIDCIIPHQTSLTTIHAAAHQMNKALGGPFLNEKNVINNLAERGNTSTTSHVVALYDAALDGRIGSGNRALFSIAGSGITVGTAVYVLDDLPDRLASGAPSTRVAPPVPPARALRHSSPPIEVAGIGLAGPDQPENTTTLNLIAAASAGCLRMAGRSASDVELLIHAGLYRTGMIAEPPIAAVAAGELGFDGTTSESGNVLAFDLGNGGLGLFDACRVASSLIGCGAVGNALVVASEVEQREPGVTRPDIAACGSALFLRAGRPRGRGLLGFHVRHFSDAIDAFAAWAEQAAGHTFIRSGDRATLAQRYLEHLPAVVAELLDDWAVKAESIRAVVPPSMSPTNADRLRRSWPVLGERVVALPWPSKDLFTSSLAFGLRRLQDAGLVATGDLVVLTGAASGVQVGAALYRC